MALCVFFKMVDYYGLSESVLSQNLITGFVCLDAHSLSSILFYYIFNFLKYSVMQTSFKLMFFFASVTHKAVVTEKCSFSKI